MSLLSVHRRMLQREEQHAVAELGKIADIGKKIGRKQGELGRAKTASQSERIGRQIKNLGDDRSAAEKRMAGHQGKAADLQKKILREEAEEQKERDRELERSQADVERRITDTAGEVGRLSDRMAAVEDALMERVREALAEDRVPRKHDVFLSHAGPDEEIAAELYQELTARDLDVWFDGAKLELGRSTTRQIDRGIAQSRVGVVLITEAFVEGRYWTEVEFGAFMASRKRLIPILDGVDRETLAGYSPILADLKGLDTRFEGFDGIAKLIAEALVDD